MQNAAVRCGVEGMFETFRTAHGKDPALRGISGYINVFFYPGVQAIWAHKASHALYRAGIPVLPVAISHFARMFTGVEIHPGATIGRRFFIDHGIGVIIGETAEIGDDVMLYHGVTLGGRGYWKDKKGSKRHPTLEDGVTVGVGSIILGPVKIGKGSRIGAGSIILRDVPANSAVRAGTIHNGQ